MKILAIILFSLSFAIFAQRPDIDPDPPATMFPPAESMAKTVVPEGFHLELVASEPMIEDPVCLAWGPDGELYVAEMRSYMIDVDMTDELTPISQVIRLVDTDGDGKMDTRTVYLDNLTLPRAILTLDNKVLIGEPPNLWLCEDTDGDGVADKKESIYANFAKKDSGNVEHKINGLQWTLDNWIYNAKTATRFRYEAGNLREENLLFMGQWGHSTNDRGERFLTTNSNPAIGLFVRTKYLAHHPMAKRNESLFNRMRRGEGYGTTWPIQGTPDTQGGPGLSRKDDRSLQRFTAACGQTIFRGDRLGDALKGSYWVPEPVGRFVRCSTVTYEDGYVTLDNVLEAEKAEFIASRDANFRPVNMYTGPDGTLYMIDMYRGIIQHGNWTREGSYLRSEILRRGLDKNVGKGRIYRLVKDDIKPGPLPTFSTASTSDLVQALRHPNGWWRDEAQKLLILRADSAATKLLEVEALTGPAPLGRVHAIWALEGLGKWTATLATKAAGDADMDVRLAALQASDSLIPSADKSLLELVSTPLADDSVDVTIQRLSSLSLTTNRANQVDRVMRVAAAHIDRDAVSKTILIALNPSEYITALRAIGENSELRNSSGKLPDNLSFAVLRSEDPEQISELIDVAAAAPPEFRDLILKGLRSGPAARNLGGLIRYKVEPPGLQKLKAAGVPAHMLSPLTAKLTWPGDIKYTLKKALKPLNKAEQALFDDGRNIYKTLCANCHGPNGEGVPMPDNADMKLAPPLAGSPRVLDNNHRFATEILLKGMTGPIDGITYGGIMAPMEANTDEWAAAVLTYIRRSWDNGANPVSPANVKQVRGWHKNMTVPFTEETLKFPTQKKKKKDTEPAKRADTEPTKKQDTRTVEKKPPAPKPKKVLVPPTADELKKVEAAIPAKLPAQPAKARRLLVYSQSHGFKHNSRLIGEEMLTLIANKTSAFTPVINNDPEAWTPDYLKGFDAILVLNATGLEYGFRQPQQRKAFLDFVANGGGIAGIHAATDGGKKKWPEYSEMWGGSFGGHPWGKTGTWTIENCAPEHPVNASFGGKGFDINDELYRQTHPYKKGNFHTLCCVDLRVKHNTHNPNGVLKKVPSDLPRKPGEPPPPKVGLDLDREYPTSWVKAYGRGRVFYTTFGHNESVYWNPAIVEHYIRGIQYALGDLKADASPDPID